MEEVSHINSPPKKRLKTILFTIFVSIFALGGLILLESLQEGLLPWVTIGCPGCDAENPVYNVGKFRWFGAEHGALVGIMFSGSLIALLWKPWNKPLLLQFYILGHIIFLGLSFLIGTENPDAAPFIELIFLIPLIILALTYPGKGLWNNMFKSANYSRPLLLLTLIAFIFMAPSMWDQLQSQLNVVSEFAKYNRWAESIQLFSILIFSNLLAATRKPGWKELTILIGISYLFLGIAAITVPGQEGSWGIYGGIISILGGISYIGIASNRFKTKK
ncbi:hypothetical protein KHA93_16450 [Bacillus sp. FJAT-49732]|uniref:Uncharacterized protein n=1 Tax=Lederbergia citrisecunda TaxID=2833583 RepID=A0A942YN04_9BACI|nr:hypothetical protein [Lederbergia citrisecunda]MBS4201230.1 hypothetical protein [Lederbergia citrisecunda]